MKSYRASKELLGVVVERDLSRSGGTLYLPGGVGEGGFGRDSSSA